jgi:crotonobetainyl-CoA:carnitine CoA-transferase CaiB-like acyl-CoA transferase
MEQGSGPLDGVRVVGVGGGVAAGYCCHLLAGYGAQVVRLVSSDDPPLEDAQQAYLTGGIPAVSGRTGSLEALAASTDVIIDSRAPATVPHSLALWEARPELVVTSITPFGRSGPYAEHQASNIVSFAAGGIMSLTGDADRPPLQTGGDQAQMFGGLHSFAATTVALLGALLHGRGDHIDISLQEAAASVLELYAAMWEYDSELSVRMGNSVRAEWGVYPVADGYAGVCCLGRQIPALLELLGEDDLDDRFLDTEYRRDHNDELLAHLLGFMVGRTKDDLVALSPLHRIPFGAVRTPAELAADEGLRGRDFFDQIEVEGVEASVPGRLVPGLGWHRPAGPEQESVDDVLAAWERTT